MTAVVAAGMTPMVALPALMQLLGPADTTTTIILGISVHIAAVNLVPGIVQHLVSTRTASTAAAAATAAATVATNQGAWGQLTCLVQLHGIADIAREQRAALWRLLLRCTAALLAIAAPVSGFPAGSCPCCSAARSTTLRCCGTRLCAGIASTTAQRSDNWFQQQCCQRRAHAHRRCHCCQA